MIRKITILLFAILIFFQMGYPAEEVLNDDLVLGRNFVTDNSGSIFIDYGAHSIVKYSPKGSEVMRFGRHGEGPGDFKRLGWFFFNPLDSLIYVSEFTNGNKWVSKFTTEGKFKGLWDCEMDWKAWEGLPIMSMDHKGNVYIETVKTSARKDKFYFAGFNKRAILKFSPGGKLLKEIYRFEADFYAERGGMGNITIPFINYLYWLVHENFIIVRENQLPFISIFDLDGKLVKKIDLPFSQEPVTEADKDNWYNTQMADPIVKKRVDSGVWNMKFWRKYLDFPKTKPVSGAQMFVDADGYLYSKQYTQTDTPHDTWAKINLKTSEIKIVYSPKGLRLCHIKGKDFYIAVMDKDKVVRTDDKTRFFKETK